MLMPHQITVRLHAGGRRFSCPYCRRSHEHPPCDLEYYTIGYGFCALYLSWFPIAGGDGLGVVRMGERGRLHTVLYGKDNPRPQAAEQAEESAVRAGCRTDIRN